MTFQPNAPASRIAQAKQPLLLRLMSAFHPLSAQMALTSISASLPNCLRRVSECIFLDALSNKKPLSLMPPGLVGLDTIADSCSDDIDDMRRAIGDRGPAPPNPKLSDRLTTGDSGISCSCGRD